MGLTLANNAANGACSAIVKLIDVSTPGYLRIYTATGTQLVACAMAAVAFNTAGVTSAGVATAATIVDGIVAASGTAGYCSFVDGASAAVVTSMTVNTSGADLNMTNINFEVSDVVSISSFKVTVPLS